MLFVAALGLLCCGRPHADAYIGGPTAEDGAVVDQVLAKAAPADTVTSDLIQLLLSENHGVAVLAAEKLKARELNESHIGTLRAIVWDVPFRLQSCVGGFHYPGYDVSSAYAWDVLADAQLRGRPVAEQIVWLMAELRWCRPFAASRSDAAASRLEKIGEPAVPALIRALERDSTNAQLWAGRTLVQIGSEEAKAAVEAWALGTVEATDDHLVWWSAAHWLGGLKSRRAYDALERMLWAHLDGPNTWTLIAGLVSVDPDRAVAPLARILVEHEPDEAHKERIGTYVCAANGLGRIGDERGARALSEAAKSPMVELRREVPFAARWGLGEGARDILERLAADPDELTALRAKQELDVLARALQPPPAVPDK